MRTKKLNCDCLKRRGVMLRSCMGREVHNKKSELHFECTEVSLYSRIRWLRVNILELVMFIFEKALV